MDTIEILSSDSSNEEEKSLSTIRKELVRDKSNPLELSDIKFIKLFRLSKDAFLYILDEVKDKFKKAARAPSIPPVLKLAAFLRFTAEGIYQKGCGEDFYIGMSQSAVSKNMSEMLDIFENHICSKWISLELSSEEKEKSKKFFLDKANIPGVIGCVDNTHINIISPKENDHLFINRKGQTCLNAMVVCDYKMRITSIDARHGGTTHDSTVWNLSSQRAYLKEQWENGDTDSWLLGDSAYPLEPWILTPYREATVGTKEARFNTQHAKCRNTIEMTIRVLKNRFRCLSGSRELRYNPEKVEKIINACGVLHNICVHYNVEFNEEYNIISNDDIDYFEVNGNEIEQNELVGRRIRDKISNSINV